MRFLSPAFGRRLLAIGLVWLGLGNLQTGAGEPQADKPAPARTFEATIVDSDGKPVAGAVITVHFETPAGFESSVLTTDAAGRFVYPIPKREKDAGYVQFLVYKPGFAPASGPGVLYEQEKRPPLQIKLRKAARLSGILVDLEGRPVSGAKVGIELLGRISDPGSGDTGGQRISPVAAHIRREIVGIPELERALQVVTAPDGSFTLPESREDSWVKLGATTADGKLMNVREEKPGEGELAAAMHGADLVPSRSDEPTRLVAVPAARVEGRVVTKLPGVPTANLRIEFEQSHPRGTPAPLTRQVHARTMTKPDGRFVIDGLSDGTINIFVHAKGEGKAWTYAAAKDVALKSGETAEVTIALIRGVDVEGTVVDKSTGKPVKGAEMGVYGPFRPRTSGMTTGVKTEAEGRYRYLLPPGETFLYVMGPPAGYLSPPAVDTSLNVTIPEDAARFTVPPISLVPAVTVKGRVINLNAQPMPGVTIIDVWHGTLRQVNRRGTGLAVVTDAKGEFHLPPSYNATVAVGESAQVRVRLADKTEHELTAFPVEGGSFRVVVPVK